jgi:hypothetical protein
MADVVELFGVPGVGKSSLMRALDGRRIDGRTVVAAPRLLRVPRSAMPGTASLAGSPVDAALPRRVVDRVLRRDLTPAERRAAVTARRADWAPLLDMIATAPLGRDDGSGPLDALEVLHAPGRVSMTLELRALADAAPDDLIVVLDEGLAQRARLVCGPVPEPGTVERYVAALPPAALQVHLVAEPAVVASRLAARERVIDRHAGLDADELERSVARDAELLERIASALVARGDAVLRVPEADGVPDVVISRLGRSLG